MPRLSSAGVDTDVNVRLQGQGDVGERKGPAGHVFVQIKVEKDPFFERDGADVHVKVPVTVSQCALGATVSIPTLKVRTQRVSVAVTYTHTHSLSLSFPVCLLLHSSGPLASPVNIGVRTTLLICIGQPLRL
jgi:hypothetical protein